MATQWQHSGTTMATQWQHNGNTMLIKLIGIINFITYIKTVMDVHANLIIGNYYTILYNSVSKGVYQYLGVKYGINDIGEESSFLICKQDNDIEEGYEIKNGMLIEPCISIQDIQDI